MNYRNSEKGWLFCDVTQLSVNVGDLRVHKITEGPHKDSYVWMWSMDVRLVHVEYMLLDVLLDDL